MTHHPECEDATGAYAGSCTTEAADLIAELVEALRKSNRIMEALADNDLDEPIADNGMTVGAALQYEAPKLAFSNCALLVKLSGIGTQVSDKAGAALEKQP